MTAAWPDLTVDRVAWERAKTETSFPQSGIALGVVVRRAQQIKDELNAAALRSQAGAILDGATR